MGELCSVSLATSLKLWGCHILYELGTVNWIKTAWQQTLPAENANSSVSVLAPNISSDYLMANGTGPRKAGTAKWLALMWQYLAHMASVPPDPQHNQCIRFPQCPLCIHGSSNASVRSLVKGFIYMEKYPPPHGVWTNRLESQPALPVRFHVCEWMHLLIITSLPSLFGVTHWMGGYDLESFSSYRLLGLLMCLLRFSQNYEWIRPSS